MKQHWPEKRDAKKGKAKQPYTPITPKPKNPSAKTSSPHKSETHTYLPFGRRFGRLAAWAWSCHFELLPRWFKKPATGGWSEENKLKTKPASKRNPSKTSISPNKCMMYTHSFKLSLPPYKIYVSMWLGRLHWLTNNCDMQYKMKCNEFYRRKWRTM